MGRAHRRTLGDLRSGASHGWPDPWRIRWRQNDRHDARSCRHAGRKAIPALAHDRRAPRIPKSRRRPPPEILPAPGRAETRHPPDRMDLRSPRTKKRALQFRAPGRYRAPLHSQLLRRHRKPVARGSPHRSPGGRMVAGFRSREKYSGRKSAANRSRHADHFAAGKSRRLESPRPRSRRARAVRSARPLPQIPASGLHRHVRRAPQRNGGLYSGTGRFHGGLASARISPGRIRRLNTRQERSASHMRLRKITLREIHMPLVAPFQTSFGETSLRRILLIEVDADGTSGWGECTAGEDPYYSYETVETAWHILRDFLWPIVKYKEFDSAAEVFDMLARVRGHNMAKAGLETAIWDAEAKQQNLPLAKLLGGTRDEISSGVSIGIQPDIPTLLAKVEKELAAGYQRIKIKIKPGNDVAPARALREKFPRIRLMVDANSAYRLEDAPLLKQLDAFYLIMIEQPLGHDDIYSHAALQRQLDTPICLDECIHDIEHARAAIEIGACKIINIKLGRVGGHTPARRIHDLCQQKSIPVWCGGMLESGIGRAHNIAMSTLPNFTLPGDVSASRRYWTEDIIEPEVEVTAKGTIRVPTAPGIGYAPRLDRIEALTKRREVLD